jgi:hypothetical protein
MRAEEVVRTFDRNRRDRRHHLHHHHATGVSDASIRTAPPPCGSRRSSPWVPSRSPRAATTTTTSPARRPRPRSPPRHTSRRPLRRRRGGADLTAYCDAAVTIQKTAAAQGDPDADPKAFAAALVEPAKSAAALAPAEIADLYKAQLAALQSVVTSGDGSALGDGPNPDILAFDKAHCGWTKVDVHAEDYHFMDCPTR